MTLPRCTHHNGSYACSLFAGHASAHRTAPFFTAAGVKQVARFSDNYSAVRFATH